MFVHQKPHPRFPTFLRPTNGADQNHTRRKYRATVHPCPLKWAADDPTIDNAVGSEEPSQIFAKTTETEWPPLLEATNDTSSRPECNASQTPLNEQDAHQPTPLEIRSMEQETPAHPESSGTGLNRKKKLRSEKSRDQLLERKRNRTRATMPLKDTVHWRTQYPHPHPH